MTGPGDRLVRRRPDRGVSASYATRSSVARRAIWIPATRSSMSVLPG